MPYTTQYVAAIVVAGLSAMIAAVLLVPSDALGLNSQTVGWLGVVAGLLGTLGGFLPRVTAKPTPAREGLD